MDRVGSLMAIEFRPASRTLKNLGRRENNKEGAIWRGATGVDGHEGLTMEGQFGDTQNYEGAGSNLPIAGNNDHNFSLFFLKKLCMK